MIERVVLLNLKDEWTNPERLAEVAEHSFNVLRVLPRVLNVHVGRAADERTAGTWHLSLVLRFAAIEHIPPYAAHPDHRAYVDEYLKPKLKSLVAYNFEI